MVKKKRRNTKKNSWETRPVKAFRMDQDINLYLMKIKGEGLESNFINRSVRFQIMLIEKPLNVLKYLKKLHPKIFTYVNRLKF